MPVITCPTSKPACTTCPDDFPVLNLSAEEPDSADDFMGYFNGGGIPLGDPFSSKGCAFTVFSEISQEDADLQAQLQAKNCFGNNNGPPADPCAQPGICGNNPDDPGGGFPVPIPHNTQQSISCPNGVDLVNISATLPDFLSISGSSLVCAANAFTGLTQADADFNASSFLTSFFNNSISSGALLCEDHSWKYFDPSPTQPFCYCFVCQADDTDWKVPGVTLTSTTFSIIPTSCTLPCFGGGPLDQAFSFTVYREFGPYSTDHNVVVNGTVHGNSSFGGCGNIPVVYGSLNAIGMSGGTVSSHAGTFFPTGFPIPSFPFTTPVSVSGVLLAGQTLRLEITAQHWKSGAPDYSFTGTISVTPV